MDTVRWRLVLRNLGVIAGPIGQAKGLTKDAKWHQLYAKWHQLYPHMWGKGEEGYPIDGELSTVT